MDTQISSKNGRPRLYHKKLVFYSRLLLLLSGGASFI